MRGKVVLQRAHRSRDGPTAPARGGAPTLARWTRALARRMVPHSLSQSQGWGQVSAHARWSRGRGRALLTTVVDRVASLPAWSRCL